MTHHLQNHLLSLSVSELGAEMQSLISLLDGKEWLWDADPDFWPRTAPILFPIVGKLADNQYICNGRYYPLSQHGFARDRIFELVESAPDRMRFVLRADYETHKFYPFDFELFVQYSLVQNQVKIAYEVVNADEKEMYFSIGGHPGFALPGWPQKGYALVFEKEEKLNPFMLKSGLLGRKLDESIPLKGNKLFLTENLFENDALVFNNLRSKWIGVQSEDKTHEMRVHLEGFPWVGLWAKTGASFVCIEPWFGHADPVGESGELSTKPAILQLDPGARFQCGYSIELNPS